MIPEGWQIREFYDVASIKGGLVDPKSAAYRDYLHVGPENIDGTSGTIIDPLSTAAEIGLISGKFEFDSGAILYSKIRPNLNKVARASHRGICSADMYVVSSASGETDLGFLYHLLRGEEFYKQAVAGSMRSGLPKVNRDDLGLINVTMPPHPQQRRIAAVLDAWDDAIATAEKLVAAKERLGIAFMQRLVGDCHNPFQVQGQPLGELALVEYGKAVAEADYDENGSSWVLGTQGKIGASNQSDFKGEAVVVGRKGTLNNPIYIPAGQPFRSIDTTFVLKPQGPCKALFFYLRHINLAKLNEASGVPSVSGDTLKSLPIPDLPDMLERVMSGVEEQLAELKSRATLLRTQKRGLMQKLLTGQWRVPDSIDAFLPAEVSS